jgi:hypothetical protein
VNVSCADGIVVIGLAQASPMTQSACYFLGEAPSVYGSAILRKFAIHRATTPSSAF